MQRYRILVYSLVLTLMVILLNPNQSYAIHYSENLIWQVVMISSTPACSNYHYQMVEKYSELTKGYFELYELDDDHYQGECLTESDFSWKYQKPHDLDLLIIAYDKNKGEADLHPLDIGGLYSHSGEDLTHNHTIIFCDCSDFNYSNPAWILSHELSHFVLNYLGYELSIVEKEIHEIDHKYDYCFENHQDESCEGVVTKIKSEKYSNTFTVMAPYEDAIGLGFTEDSEEVFLYDTESKMLTEITKWWIDGRISDYYFAKSIEILTGVSSKKIVESNEALLKKPDWLLIAEPPKNIELAEKQDLSEKTKEILQTFPFIDLQTDNNEEIKIPDWFKSKSKSWVEDKIEDEEFFAGIEQFLFSEDPSVYVENNDVAVEDIVEEAMLLIDKREYNQAMALLDRALWDSLENDSLSIDAMNGKGIALFLVGNHQESLIYFDLVLEIDPQNYEATKKKAHVLAQIGQFDEATKYFEKSLLL